MTGTVDLLPHLVVPLAFILDFFLGDPTFLPHPIRWMGRAIAVGEGFFRRRLPPGQGGRLMTVLLVAAAWGLTWVAVRAAHGIDPRLGMAAEIVLIYYTLATRSLDAAARTVSDHLDRQDLPAARRSVAMIVGRETDRLDGQGVSRAAIETVAENLVDGIVAPLLYAVIGGAPLAMAYKMVNTLDSMIGYKNERYRDFGKTAARLDDVANWAPARLAVPLIALSAALLNGRWRPALAMACRDGQKHTSPNAGLSEAAFAGVLAIRLGGPNRYHGVTVAKPWIGEVFGRVRAGDIGRACDLMLLTAAWALLVFWGLSRLLTLMLL